MDPKAAAEALAVLRALADPIRLRVAGRLAARPASVAQLVDELGMGRIAAARALAGLEEAGLVKSDGERWTIDRTTLARLGRELNATKPSPDVVPAATATGRVLDRDETRILRSFLARGRLRSIPVAGRKREVVLRYLLDAVFPDETDRPERDVNDALRQYHEDVAALRRYLVDAGLVSRERGIYRRATPPASASGV
ncbi:MAG TPA: DUF2087 domain-containing protein [Candidatus Limnocylindrales bacterium]